MPLEGIVALTGGAIVNAALPPAPRSIRDSLSAAQTAGWLPADLNLEHARYDDMGPGP